MKKIFDGAYYFPGETNVGMVFTPDGDCCRVYLVDTGMDPEGGETILNELDSFFGGKYTIQAIINTHGHSDHVGMNHYFQKKTGAGVYITEKETAIVKNPAVNVERIWGASCIPQLKKWYSLGERFEPTKIITAGSGISFGGGEKIDFVPLYGHSAEHIGVLYSGREGKKVLFSGDSFLGLDELQKCGISYHEFPLDAMESMSFLLDFDADYFVPSHGDVPSGKSDAESVIKKNLGAFESLVDLVFAVTEKRNMTTEEIVSEVARKFKIPPRPVSYALIYSTTKSLLSQLYECGRLGISMENCGFYWTKKNLAEAASRPI